MDVQHRKGLIVLICILAVAAGLFIYQAVASSEAVYTVRTVSDRHSGSKRTGVYIPSNSIAVLYIEGVIEEANKTYNQQWLMDTISQLKYDSRNKGILLYIDSPGGAVYQADELYLALVDYGNSGKPVFAALGPMAASGGYYIACAAGKIYANRNTLTGSIGVIFGTSLDLTGLFEKYGIRMTTITAGKNKNMMNIDSPLTAEQKKIMQSIADEAYDQFTGIVAESRKMDIGDVVRLADGRIYTARQAVRNGLIDGTADFQETKDIMIEQEFGGIKYDFQDYRYEQQTSLYDYFFNIKNAFSFSPEAALPGFLANILENKYFYPAYYCPSL